MLWLFFCLMTKNEAFEANGLCSKEMTVTSERIESWSRENDEERVLDTRRTAC